MKVDFESIKTETYIDEDRIKEETEDEELIGVQEFEDDFVKEEEQLVEEVINVKNEPEINSPNFDQVTSEPSVSKQVFDIFSFFLNLGLQL